MSDEGRDERLRRAVEDWRDRMLEETAGPDKAWTWDGEIARILTAMLEDNYWKPVSVGEL